MIYTVHIENPKTTPSVHWESVKWLKTVEKLEFKPGLNILFGSNGTGKSTVISAIAMAFHCYQTNWPVVTKQSVNAFLKSSGLVANGLTIDHDGAPAKYLGLGDMDSIPENAVRVDLSLSAHGAHAGRPGHLVSAGQKTVSRLIHFLRNDPKSVSYKLKSSQVTPEFKPVWTAAVEALKNGVARKGVAKQQVILLDEVDLNLDFAHQAAVWAQLRELANEGNHQIIVASHSVFAVNVPGAHYIETSPGYLKDSRQALKLLMNVEVDQPINGVAVKAPVKKKRLSIS